MHKSYVIVFFFMLFYITPMSAVLQSKKINPLSRITITSDQATCQKNTTEKNMFIFSYQHNVCVTLADGTIITTDTLEIIFEGNAISSATTSSQSSSKKTTLQNFKKIMLIGNVKITNENRIITANNAQFDIERNTCLLDGNVQIEQTQHKEKDIPLTISSPQASIDLNNYDVTFSGSPSKPVSTIISLEQASAKKTTPPSRKIP